MKIIICIAICLAVGFLTGMATRDSITTWYSTLNKPSFNPPNWLFGPVWTVLYILMGISAGIIWDKGLETQGVKIALTLFSIQLLLNGLWSIIFFGMQSPTFALVDIILMLLAIIACIILFYPVSPAASFMLIPYLLWVSFATLLNSSIVHLNKDRLLN